MAASDVKAPEHRVGEAVAGLKTVLRRRKRLSEIEEQAATSAEHEGGKYSLFDLLAIGVGSTVGSGCFVLTGVVLPVAGPSAVLSWLVAGLACTCSAVAYIELSGRIPASGSCYIFSFHTLGELGGVLAALCLTLEYGVSAAGCARSWSALFAHLTNTETQLQYWYPRADRSGGGDSYIDLGAGAMVVLSTALCSSGVDFGKIVINSFTIAKVILLAFLIIGGLAASDINVFQSAEAFFPTGFSGTMKGASVLFWGFVGFDEVCCMAGKAQNPERNMPRALIGTLAITCLVSVLSQLAIVGIAPWDKAASWPSAFEDKGWIWAKVIASIGEVVLLPLLVILSFLPQPELCAAMAQDGLIPAIFAQQDRKGTFVWGSNIAGAFTALMAMFMPFDIIWNLVSLGVILSFNLTSSALIMLRYGNGGSVDQPQVAYLVMALWASGAVSAYSLWKGFLEPALDGLPWSPAALAAFVAGLGGAVAALVAISRHGQQIEEAPSAGPARFRTPGVPFVPGAAIGVNFVLMATFSWRDHLVLCVFLAAGLSVYVAGRVSTLASPKEVRQAKVATPVSA